jgi:hypothetical protein
VGQYQPFVGVKKQIPVSIARIVHGRTVEGWDNWDQLGMLEQIGVYKQPEAMLLV